MPITDHQQRSTITKHQALKQRTPHTATPRTATPRTTLRDKRHADPTTMNNLEILSRRGYSDDTDENPSRRGYSIYSDDEKPESRASL